MDVEQNLDVVEPVKYDDGRLYILDQTALPKDENYIEIRDAEDIYDAICKLKVRGAPAIGVAAAYGLLVSIKKEITENSKNNNNLQKLLQKALELGEHIAGARPTAVNLRWATSRMTAALEKAIKENPDIENGGSAGEYCLKILEEEAVKIHEEDLAACRSMGAYGLELLKSRKNILTHCNAGTLATSKYGTCLAPIYIGREQGIEFKVFADETRPLLQGARLTAWELSRAGVDVTLICDNMAASLMSKGKVDAVVVGCDRMAANGDGANKIGTMGLAILAKEYKIPFYMFVPTSTIDLATETGEDIVIEERNPDEIWKLWYEHPMSTPDIKCFNPAFDVTAAKYITAVITEKGIVYPPYKENLTKIFEKGGSNNE